MSRDNRKQVTKQTNNHKLNEFKRKNNSRVHQLMNGMSGRVRQRYLKIK